jgi:hypothetical protein
VSTQLAKALGVKGMLLSTIMLRPLMDMGPTGAVCVLLEVVSGGV